MSVKQILIVVFFMMFIVNFIPRANASLVELEFSNGATLSFDDTISEDNIIYPGTTGERRVRRYNTVSSIVSHPDNILTNPYFSKLRSYEAIGEDTYDFLHSHSRAARSAGGYISNYIWSNEGFKLIDSGISASLVDAIGLDNMFTFWGRSLDDNDRYVYNHRETVTLTSVKLDGVTHTPNPVPVPGAVWLFGSAIIGLIARRKLGGVK